MTICVECKHVVVDEPAVNKWSYTCKAHPNKEAVCPLTGATEYVDFDLNRTHEAYKHCLHINKGKCPDFELREPQSDSLLSKTLGRMH